MQKDKTARLFVVIAICIATVSMAIAYAAFSTSLNIGGTATVAGNQWSVSFLNLGDPVTTTGSAESTSAKIEGNTTFSYAVNFIKPGDSVTYTFDVKNTGQINAKLDSITTEGFNAADDIDYVLTYSDGSAINEGDTLSVGETRSLKLTVSYKSTATAIPDEDVAYDLETTLVYVQA